MENNPTKSAKKLANDTKILRISTNKLYRFADFEVLLQKKRFCSAA